MEVLGRHGILQRGVSGFVHLAFMILPIYYYTYHGPWVSYVIRFTAEGVSWYEYVACREKEMSQFGRTKEDKETGRKETKQQ